MNRFAVSRGAAFEQLELDLELRDSAFGTRLQKADFAVIALACAAASAAAAIVATGGVVRDPTAFAAVLVANIATLAVGGLAWRRGRPSSLFGYLLLAEGLLVFVSSLSGSPDSVLHLIGVLGIWATAFGATWLLLVFPGSRPGAAGWIVMGIALATFLVGELPLILTSPRLEGLTTIASCGAACPANPALAVHAPNVADAFRNVEGVLQATWGVGLLFYLATRFAWASHARRRVILPVFVSAAPLAAAFTLNAVAFGLAGVQSSGTARAIFAGTRILYPLGFVAGLLLARAYAGEALTFMARRLVGRPSVAAVEQLVRRVLDDPQARLVFLAAAQRAVRRSTRSPRRSRPGTGDPHLARVRAWRRPGPGRRPRPRAERGSRARGGRRGRLAAGARESPAGARSARLGARATRVPAAARGSSLGGAAEDRA